MLDREGVERGEAVIRWSRLACGTAVAVVAGGFASACGSSQTAPLPSVILWTQSPHGGEQERGSIGRAELTGASANGHFIVGAKSPAGIALDGRYIYWANDGRGTIARARLDGSDVNELFIKVAESIVGVAVHGHHIYWTSSGLDFGTIGVANLDGSSVNKHFIKAGDSPIGLAVDNQHIYWTHRYWNRNHTMSGSAVGRANIDGSHTNTRFIDASNRLDGVAVTDHYLFWSNNGEHAIGRANLDGTDIRQRCITTTTIPLESVPEGLATDGRYVYWTAYPANTIGRANLDGSGVNDNLIAVKGVPEGIAAASSNGAASPAGRRCVTSQAPLLFGPIGQRAGPYGEGWGEVAPAIVSNGGAAASGTVFQIHWSSWGGRVAIGRGLHPTYAPKGGYYPKPVVMELRASAIKRCTPGGRLVYTRFTAREQVKPGGPMGKWGAWAPNMCAGFR